MDVPTNEKKKNICTVCCLTFPKIRGQGFTRVHIVGVSFSTCIKILSWILNSHFFTHDISCCSWSKNHLTIRPYNYGGICFAWSTNRMQIPLYLYSLAGDFYWHDHMTSCDDVTTADIMSKKMWIEDSRKNFFVSSIRYTHIINSRNTNNGTIWTGF